MAIDLGGRGLVRLLRVKRRNRWSYEYPRSPELKEGHLYLDAFRLPLAFKMRKWSMKDVRLLFDRMWEFLAPKGLQSGLSGNSHRQRPLLLVLPRHRGRAIDRRGQDQGLLLRPLHKQREDRRRALQRDPQAALPQGQVRRVDVRRLHAENAVRLIHEPLRSLSGPIPAKVFEATFGKELLSPIVEILRALNTGA